MRTERLRVTNETLLQGLTEPQIAAVTHVRGPLLILAGPGSGKTRVVTHRIVHMLRQGIHGKRILALTFTNKAADEMKNRVERLVGGRSGVWLSTFHRFCSRLLRQYARMVGLEENFSIYDTDDSYKALVQSIDDAKVELTHTTPDAVTHAISWAKNNLLTPAKFTGRRGNLIDHFVEKIYPAYQKRLLASNAVDFDDLLLHTATLLRENPDLRHELDERYQYIMVDEYQDTNLAQYAIVRALSIDHPNLAVTGDPDQSIYGWRGANLNNILDFEKDYPSVKVVRLEQNYRSSKRILEVADALIRRNVWRKHKDLWTDNDEGKRVRLNAYPSHVDEASFIAERIASDVREERRRPRDFAIFYRTNALSRQIEHALREQGLPYQIVNGLSFYQRKEVKDALAYLQLLNNPRNDVAFERIINTPTRGIGKSTIARIREYGEHRGLPLLEAAREAGLIPGLPKKAATSVAKFVALFDKLGTIAHAPVEEILGFVLSESGYREALLNSEAEEDLERLANLEEFLTAAREFDAQHPEDGGLERFLEDSSLVADTDAFESETDKVTMMTLHAAKGLEFPCVFIVACEQGLLPHERSRDDEKKLEEERRLLFVGITRAMEELELSYAQYRVFRGRSCPTVPSPFLLELPRKEMEQSDSVASYRTTGDFFDESQLRPDADEFGSEWRDENDDYSQLEEPRIKSAKNDKTFTPLVSGIDLLKAQTTPRTSPDVFHQGMLVTHPEYGAGTIIALSGQGVKRSAVIRFLRGGEKKFLLIHAHLTPLASDE